ncbi:class II aldolase [Fulvimarina endophytica]|uniref:Class II aldolase n=1 Tax=Fulvimarina endophytica TaxID=2293836 RepID=A0A371XB87_9HYPH|nr:class II aldolase/adducin family protein [Fulvimarina endophytica]RFC66506.1 class II aldolase [Fulvimarina endophytica]
MNSQDGEADQRASLIETCLRMNAEGLNQGTSGNVSVRHGNGMLITPSGVPYTSMRPDMIVPMSLDGDWSGDMKPSSEWRMHLDIYRTRAEAEAVVHVHSTYATALSCLRRSIPAFHYMVGVAGGADIRCADYATFGTAELSEAMIEALDGRRACLLANHGQIAFGTSVERAYGLAVEVETLARQYAAACSLGEPVLIDGAEMQRILELFKTYGIQKPRS